MTGRRAFLRAAAAAGMAGFLAPHLPAEARAGGDVPMKTLNNGMSLPMVGLVTYSAPKRRNRRIHAGTSNGGHHDDMFCGQRAS